MGTVFILSIYGALDRSILLASYVKISFDFGYAHLHINALIASVSQCLGFNLQPKTRLLTPEIVPK